MKLAARMVGALQAYTGTTGSGSGYLDDFDGRWVYLTSDSFRTIGGASSGADLAADWLQTLFSHLWSSYDNTRAPLLTSAGGASSRGASATADWSANRRITFPDFRGRIILGAGSGSSLTARTKGTTGGAETHTLATSEIPSHQHSINAYVNNGVSGTIIAQSTGQAGTLSIVNVNAQGGGGSHNNMQPWTAEHLLISSGVRP